MKGLDTKKLKLNWKAGLSVAMINIPLSISLAVASGATPLQGLLTGIWGGIFASIFASSKFNIFGVAGALSGILLTFAIANGPALLPFIAIFAGIIILLVYAFKITKYITLIPATALHGFMVGVGITIAAGQFNSALGLSLPQSEKVYLGIWNTILHVNETNIPAFIMFSLGFAFLFTFKKKFPKFPAVITLTVLGIGLGYLVKFGYLPKVMLLADKNPGLSFSPIINIFKGVEIKDFGDFMDISRKVFSTSLVVAIIAILETIISAKIAQKITKVAFSKDKEVLGLGISNIASGLFGGLPVTAVFVRTALNINAGATSKYSAFLTGAFTLIFSIILFNNGFLYLPYPIIAAILINIAVGLIDIKHLKKLYELQHTAFYITMITTFFYVIEDATIGILVGTAISLILFLKRVTDGGAKISLFRDKKFKDKLDFGKYIHSDQQDGDVILLKFSGGLNYLNQEKNIHHLELIDKKITVILSFSHMGGLDIDGVETIDEIFVSLQNKGVELYFSGLTGYFEKIISKTQIYKILHKEKRIINPTSAVLHMLLGDNFQSF